MSKKSTGKVMSQTDFRSYILDILEQSCKKTGITHNKGDSTLEKIERFLPVTPKKFLEELLGFSQDNGDQEVSALLAKYRDHKPKLAWVDKGKMDLEDFRSEILHELIAASSNEIEQRKKLTSEAQGFFKAANDAQAPMNAIIHVIEFNRVKNPNIETFRDSLAVCIDGAEEFGDKELFTLLSQSHELLAEKTHAAARAVEAREPTPEELREDVLTVLRQYIKNKASVKDIQGIKDKNLPVIEEIELFLSTRSIPGSFLERLLDKIEDRDEELSDLIRTYLNSKEETANIHRLNVLEDLLDSSGPKDESYENLRSEVDQILEGGNGASRGELLIEAITSVTEWNKNNNTDPKIFLGTVNKHLLGAAKDKELDMILLDCGENIGQENAEKRKQLELRGHLGVMELSKDKAEIDSAVSLYFINAWLVKTSDLPDLAARSKQMLEEDLGGSAATYAPQKSNENSLLSFFRNKASKGSESGDMVEHLGKCLAALNKNPRARISCKTLTSAMQKCCKDIQSAIRNEERSAQKVAAESFASTQVEDSLEKKLSDAMSHLEKATIPGSKLSTSAELERMMGLIDASNVNSAKSSKGWMPIHFVAMFGSEENFQALTILGANITARGEKNRSVLSAALSAPGDRTNIEEALLSSKLDLDHLKDGLLTAVSLGKNKFISRVLGDGKFITQISELGERGSNAFLDSLNVAANQRQKSGKNSSVSKNIISGCREEVKKSLAPTKTSKKKKKGKAATVATSVIQRDVNPDEESGDVVEQDALIPGTSFYEEGAVAQRDDTYVEDVGKDLEIVTAPTFNISNSIDEEDEFELLLRDIEEERRREYNKHLKESDVSNTSHSDLNRNAAPWVPQPGPTSVTAIPATGTRSQGNDGRGGNY